MTNQTITITNARKGGFRGCSIIAYDQAGYPFTLKHTFASRDSAKLGETLEKIRAAGQINLAHWRRSLKGEY